VAREAARAIADGQPEAIQPRGPPRRVS
jgi:hypothetical protein